MAKELCKNLSAPAILAFIDLPKRFDYSVIWQPLNLILALSETFVLVPQVEQMPPAASSFSSEWPGAEPIV